MTSESGPSLPPRRSLPRVELSAQRDARDPRSAPLTPTQRDIYLDHARHPASTQHLVGNSCRLDANLRPELWRRACETVLSQEPLTRTRLVLVGDAVQQHVEASAASLCRFVDLATEPPDIASAEDYIERDRLRPFDLFQLPLWRCYLVRERDGSYAAGLLAPHIFADGWSYKLLFESVGREYERLRRGGGDKLEPPPAMSFLDYAASGDMGFDTPEIRQFWSEALAGVEAIGLAGSGSGTGRRREELLIATDELNQIRRFCRDRGWPLVTFLRAVYALTIRKLTASTGDLPVFDIRDTRPPRFRRAIGCFFQTLPILAPADQSRGSATVADLVAAMEAHKQRAAPWARISSLLLSRLLPPQSLKCFFNFYLFETVDLLGEKRNLRTYAGYGEDEVHLVPSVTTEGLRLTLDFPAHRLPAHALERLLQLVGQVLAGTARMDRLSPMLPGEATIVKPAAADRPARGTLSPLLAVAAHAARRPEAVAVRCMGAQLSYGELERRANGLARYLMECGAGQGAIVAVALERSLDLIVSIIAILKAGAAYLPLDIEAPPERITLMLRDSGASLLVTSRLLWTARPDGATSIVLMDEAMEAASRQSEDALDVSPQPQDTAYVIYTSGSTGVPKGVLVTHANLTALLDGAARMFDFSDHDVWTMFHSVAFDFSVWEIFGALTFGGCLVVVPRETSRSGDAFYRLLQDEHVTVLSQTPSAFSVLSDWEEHGAQGLSLRYVIFGGEALRLEALSPWFRRHGDMSPTLVNMFGITETTVHVTFRRIVQSDVEHAHGRSFIGRPLPGWIVTLRDPDGHPVPPGVAGEIYVGGAGVARGYLARPELSAERFVTLRDMPDERFYRSGDLARTLPDGELEYLGRADMQIKVRGYRIEPGEVEAALIEEAGVGSAVVLAAEHAGDRRLVAYIVAEEGKAPPEAELRQRLARRLPDYMVPSRIMRLAELPRTPNGKIDRRALPVPLHEEVASEREFVTPANPLETEIAGIWSEVLGVRRVSATDEFFELGGNSLSATQMIIRVQDRCRVALPLRAAFLYTTVASLAALVGQSGGGADVQHQAVDVPPPRPDSPAPLTFAQERAWFLQQLLPENIAYHFVATLTFHGNLDIHALSGALAELVRRHEVLRTTFENVAGRPRQLVHPAWPVELKAEEASGAEAAAYIRSESVRPFDLGALPLIRWRLFRLGPARHLLVHIEHHLLHDGWSFAVLLRELLILYESFAAGQPSPLPPALWHASEAALLERRWIETEAAQRQLAFWKEALAEVPGILDLPADHPRPAVARFRGDAVRICLNDALCLRIEQFSRQRGVTPHTTLRAVFEALLHRLTGRERFVVGCGVANRRTPALESVVGMLLNNIAVPADVSGAPDFETLVSRVRETALAALDNQDIPFDHVVAAIDPERSTGRSPLCQVFFTSYDGPMPSFRLRDLQVEPSFGLSNGSAKFDLNVIVVAVPNAPADQGFDDASSRPLRSIEMIWEYSTDLFERETVERWTAWFVTLADAALRAPGRPVRELPLMSPDERERVLVTWNQTKADYPRDATIQDLFEDIARLTPDHPALVAGEEVITYGELSRRADQFAAYLASHGVSAGARVGLCLERSPHTIAAILGTLKAGAAYVPLDPGDPPERRALLRREAAVNFLYRDGGHEIFGRPSGASSSDAAYVMFTSGSTGPPKGVLVTHRNVIRLVRGTDYAMLDASQVLLQMAPLTFDASTFEIWGALLNGATLVLWQDRDIDLGELRRVVKQHHVTTLWLTAGLFRGVVRDGREALAGLRQLLAGGDVLQPDDVALVRRAYPDLRIVNGYGPTEATTFSCCYAVPMDSVAEGPVPIGRPIANTTAYVLDERLEPVPIGVPGELFIGGDGVAQGYVNAADLTAARFLPDPWGQPDGRLYRTGDRVRWRADGNLEFLGRMDRQVKVRGYRVEPAEVEAEIGLLPGVRDVAVTAVEEPAGGRRLHAFVVADGAARATELRAALASRLPGYMIPSGFTILDRLPLGPAGKVDRSGLTRRAETAPEDEDGGGRALPRNETERALVEIWASALDHGSIGIDDDFFELGGHSLMALELIHAINANLGLSLPVRFIINEPTVAKQATVIDQIRAYAPPPTQSSSLIVPLRRGGAKRPFFLVAGGFGGEAELLVYAKLAEHVDGDRPFYGLRIRGVDDLVPPADGVEAIAAELLAEVRKKQPGGPYLLGGSCIGGLVAFEMARQLEIAGESVGRLVLIDSIYPNWPWYARFLLQAFRERWKQETTIGSVTKRLFAPSDDQRMEGKKYRIGRQYLRHSVRYAATRRAGPVHMIISEQRRNRNPTRIWEELAGGGLITLYVPGDHSSHLREYARETAAAIEECLS
jgi:amino acid adenylation domain-containing protein